MSFEVLVARRAEQELNQAADWIARSAPDTAEEWFYRAIVSLGEHENPGACEVVDLSSLVKRIGFPRIRAAR